MSTIIETPAAQTVAPVSDRSYHAPHGQTRVTHNGVGRPSGIASPRLRVRVSTDNPDHHLWNNHGTWFLHYTVHPTPFTKERVRRSLGTPQLDVARERRDAFFAHWSTQSRAAPMQAVA